MARIAVGSDLLGHFAARQKLLGEIDVRVLLLRIDGPADGDGIGFIERAHGLRHLGLSHFLAQLVLFRRFVVALLFRNQHGCRPADHFFYAREKAELETLIEAERPALTGLDIYILRPSIVVGPHVMGAKGTVPAPLEPLVGAVARGIAGSPVRLPAPVPDLPVQFVHEEDVGRAFVQCIVGAGPPGAYNLAGDGRVRAGDVLRELGFAPLPVPSSLVRAPARGLASLARLPGVPPVAGWAEAFSHPAIVDTTKARTQLGWVPRFSSLDALRATVGPSS